MIAVIFLAVLSQCSPGYGFCSSGFTGDYEYPFKYFNTKTRYDTVRGELTTSIRPPGCTPHSIVILLRSGASYQGADEINEFELLQELTAKMNSTGTAEMCREDLKRIMNWKNRHQSSKGKDLTPTGEAEMKGLADRFSRVFPELFSKSGNKLRFISSDTRRTIQSAEAFASELMTGTQYEIELNDDLVKFYEKCRKYIVEVVENEALMEDVNTFSNGPVMEGIVENVTERLGIPEGEISIEQVKIMQQKGCAEQELVTGEDSPWCLVFTKEDMQAFEYAGDMEDYDKMGVGQDITYWQGCKLKHFILNAIVNASKSKGEQVTNHFIFGHAQTLLMTMTDMMLIDDDGPFTSKDYPDLVEREFRSSLHTPTAGNLAFVTYKCEDL